jgi:Rho-type GTPase-activating protein 1/2
MAEELERIMNGPDKQGDGGMLRKVSNAVKHGRSFSDRAPRSERSSSQKWPRSPMNGSMEISSPTSAASPNAHEENVLLKNRLRQAQDRISRLEVEKNGLQSLVSNNVDMTQVNTELKQKRSTMAVLDTQREMAIRELEVMTEHMRRAKDSHQALDFNELKSGVARDFAASLQRLKDTLGKQIEELMQKRNDLTREIDELIQMKDKGFQEFESLQGRNAQLLEMNNQLVHNIQETYKANRVPNGASSATNGLGIYHPGAKVETALASDVRSLNLVNTDSSMPDLLRETEAEPATVLTAPQVVNIRKGQPKKFNWRKGGEKMAKNITKGVKGAFVGESVRGKEIGMPYNATQESMGATYGQMAQQAGPGSEQSSLKGKDAAGFGFFGQKNGGLKASGGVGNLKNGSSTNLAAAVGADPSSKCRPRDPFHCIYTDLGTTALFGSDLEARCEYEKRVIPSIVTRCIEEVEQRGMDVEGIYRKSGGNTQVKAVQAGFEKDGAYDLSDPDLDIHAVTSALKQYFRKLPTPLITYDVYEMFLEAGQAQGGEKDKKKQAYQLRMAIAELPEHHRNCLEYLVQHLARVMKHERDNLMTPLNLSVVFAPTIMKPLSIEREMSDMQLQRQAVQALLEMQTMVFPEE